MTAKHRITINLDENEYQALQKIAEAAERSLAWLGRKAICDLIQEKEKASTVSAASRGKTTTQARQATR